MLYMAHRFSKPRSLQLTCPFLDKNFFQGKNELRKIHRTPSPPNWELFSKITFTDTINDKLFSGQGRILFFKACTKMHLPAVEFLLPSSLGSPALQLAWHLRWHILHTPTVCSSWSESYQWWQTSGWCVLSRGKKTKTSQTTIETASKHHSWLLIKFWSPHSWGFACCHFSLHQYTSLEWEE